MDPWKHQFIQVNGIQLHYVEAGEGPLVLLLHGFPQFWYTWRHQIPALAKKFKVVAVDLPGYGDSDKPKEVQDYRAGVIAETIAKLIPALGYQRAHIVGHDWGGAISWRLAQSFPLVVDHLVVLNCPHPYLFAKALQSNRRQLRRSWYLFFFQIPYLPEFIFKRGSQKLLKKLFRDSAVRKEAFTDADIEQYDLALKKPEALRSAFNYYRAAFRSRNSDPERKDARIAAPTMLIWGECDQALGKELTEGMAPLFTGPFQIQYIPHCSHWVNEEQPEVVNSLILEFLSHVY